MRNAMTDKIPLSTIGHLSRIFSLHYTEYEIRGICYAVAAPTYANRHNNIDSVIDLLERINIECESPLKTLGLIIQDYMEFETFSWEGDHYEIEENRHKISSSLAEFGYEYARGGYIKYSGVSPTLSLTNRVAMEGQVVIQQEIQRAILALETDPNLAVLHMSNILEATLKAFLLRQYVDYDVKRNDYRALWEICVNRMHSDSSQQKIDSSREIANGLSQVAQEIMNMNKRKVAHERMYGRPQFPPITSRQARLVVKATDAISAYVLGFLDE